MSDSSLMTIQQWLNQATDILSVSGIGTARLDAIVLLEDVTGKDRTHLLAHPELKLTHEQIIRLQKLLKRRSQHEPLAYVRGKTEFYGREFLITHDVLEPRPESETMIDLLKSSLFSKVRPLSKDGPLHVVDVGTGSGALAITAKLELPEAEVLALDIDPKCLKIARRNADKHAVGVKFIQSDLLESFSVTSHQSPVTILANLPYVPDDFHINEAALHEPKIAIFGGQDGLNLYRQMFEQLTKWTDNHIYVFTESLPFQHAELTNIASAQKFTQIAKDDFIQVFRNG